MIAAAPIGPALSRSQLTGPALAAIVLADAATSWPAVQHAAHWSVVPLALAVLIGLAGRAVGAVRAWFRGSEMTISIQVSTNRLGLVEQGPSTRPIVE